MQIATAAEMQQLDRLAIQRYGIPGVVLMENAGRGTAEIIKRVLGSWAGKTIIIFVGPGNNGGDGLVLARCAFQEEAHPLIFFACDPKRLAGDAAINVEIIKRLGLPFHILNDNFMASQLSNDILLQHGRYPVLCLVDALFGTGLGRKIEGHYATIVNYIKNLRQLYNWPLIAIDLPSGQDADTGQPLGVAVHADHTVTYGLAKPAHYLQGATNVGTVHVVDIGIPRGAREKVHLQGRALCSNLIRHKLPDRPLDSHKGSYGHLLIVGGSRGKSGAVILAALAALQSGCGLASAHVPRAIQPIVAQGFPELMTTAPARSGDTLAAEDLNEVLACLKGKKALVLGPGLGTAPETAGLVLRLYQDLELPMVVDADALNILARHPDILDLPGGPRILTPHPREMARLLHTSLQTVQHNRLQAALSLGGGSEHDIITVLKGVGTIIGHSQGPWAINRSGNPGMAVGGTGDVLAGLIGSLLTQGLTPWDAACVGVYIHGLAADMLSAAKDYGYLASELAAKVPEALTECRREAQTPPTET